MRTRFDNVPAEAVIYAIQYGLHRRSYARTDAIALIVEYGPDMPPHWLDLIARDHGHHDDVNEAIHAARTTTTTTETP